MCSLDFLKISIVKVSIKVGDRYVTDIYHRNIQMPTLKRNYQRHDKQKTKKKTRNIIQNNIKKLMT